MTTEKPIPEFKTFAEFWPFYLGEHSNPWNQRLHAVGTTIGLFLLVVAILNGQPILILPALISGYFFAWIGHFFVEHNKPATFKYPLWSFIGDFKMYGLFVTGQLGRAQEAARASKPVNG